MKINGYIKIYFPPTIKVTPGAQGCTSSLIKGIAGTINVNPTCTIVDDILDTVTVTNLFATDFKADGTSVIQIIID